MEYTEFSREKWLKAEILNLERQHYMQSLNGVQTYKDAEGNDVSVFGNQEKIKNQIAKLRQELEKVQGQPSNVERKNRLLLGDCPNCGENGHVGRS